MDEHERERLLDFVATLREDLQFVIEQSIGEKMLSESVAEHLPAAWERLLERGEFEQLEEAIRSERYDEGLERAGLSGPELEFKLAGVAEARRRHRIPVPRRLRKLLRWLNVPLKSLLAVIGAGEGIKELKEGVEAELEDE